MIKFNKNSTSNDKIKNKKNSNQERGFNRDPRA